MLAVQERVYCTLPTYAGRTREVLLYITNLCWPYKRGSPVQYSSKLIVKVRLHYVAIKVRVYCTVANIHKDCKWEVLVLPTWVASRPALIGRSPAAFLGGTLHFVIAQVRHAAAGVCRLRPGARDGPAALRLLGWRACRGQLVTLGLSVHIRFGYLQRLWELLEFGVPQHQLSLHHLRVPVHELLVVLEHELPALVDLKSRHLLKNLLHLLRRHLHDRRDVLADDYPVLSEPPHHIIPCPAQRLSRNLSGTRETQLNLHIT